MWPSTNWLKPSGGSLGTKAKSRGTPASPTARRASSWTVRASWRWAGGRKSIWKRASDGPTKTSCKRNGPPAAERSRGFPLSPFPFLRVRPSRLDLAADTDLAGLMVFQPLHVGLDHQLDQIHEPCFRFPAQFLFRL